MGARFSDFRFHRVFSGVPGVLAVRFPIRLPWHQRPWATLENVDVFDRNCTL
jgi:hypothetical protein